MGSCAKRECKSTRHRKRRFKYDHRYCGHSVMFREFISSATVFELQLLPTRSTMMEDLLPEAEPPCLACLGPPPPVFDLPPPPRPPWEANDGCANQQANSLARPLRPEDSKTGTEDLYDYQSCDINPFVIDSHFYFGENLFTVLIIVICSCILVAIIMVVAIVIYRRWSMFRRLYSDGSKSIPSLQAPTASTSDTRSQFEAASSKLERPFDDPTEMADRHVYANPTYLSHFEANSANPNCAQTASNNAATMQIGGLPFYLPKDASEPTRENIPDLASPLHGGGIVQLQDTGGMAWYNNSSLRPPQPQTRGLTQGLTGVVGGSTVGTNNGGRPLLSPRGPKIREKVTVDNEVGGPIYEDIDRMCSYRGYPPGTTSNSTTTSGGIGPLDSSSDSYYNLSGGSSSPRNKISNNSETSFEEGCGNNGNRFQTHRSPLNTIGSPSCTPRSPPVAPSSSRQPPINSNSSMYYYSDTLRKGRVGSDSGISVDTPPPRTSMQPRGQGGQNTAAFGDRKISAFSTNSGETQRNPAFATSSDQRNRVMIQTEAIFNASKHSSKKKSNNIRDTKV